MKGDKEMKVTKKQVAEFVKRKLISDPVWASHALDVVFQNQTRAEQNSHLTIENNGIGFTGVDAEFLSSLYEQKQRYGRLTPRQMGYVHKMIPKYHNQIVQASKEKGKYDDLIKLVAASEG